MAFAHPVIARRALARRSNPEDSKLRDWTKARTKEERKGGNQIAPKEPCVYIFTNERHTVLYTGVTSDLPRRIGQHRDGHGSAFTHRYNARKVVYAEFFPTMYEAIAHEKRIKGGSRARKIALIEEKNPDWRDLLRDD